MGGVVNLSRGGNGGNPIQPQGMRIDLATLPNLVCKKEGCNSKRFYSGFEIKEIPMLIAGKAGVTTAVEYFYCMACHTSTGIVRSVGGK